MTIDAVRAAALEFRQGVARLGPGPVGVAVSGGGDSMALLALALDHFEPGQVEAATVDHGLRPESADEARAVAAFCTGWGVRHETLPCGDWSGRGNLQAEARDRRYHLLANWARDRQLSAVFIGHTRDDVAETFLMRLARRSGLDGLAAMAPSFDRHGVRFRRPLLEVSRDDLRAVLEARGVPHLEDSSNENPRFERVRMRKGLEMLEDLGISREGLADVAGNLSRARDVLRSVTIRAAQRHVIEDRGDLLIPLHAGLDDEILRRLVTAGIRWIGRREFPPRAQALDRAIRRLDHDGARICIGQTMLTREGDRMRLSREFEGVKTLVVPADTLWDRRWLLMPPTGNRRSDAEIRALGDALPQCENWRDAGLPRHSLRASPSVWVGDTLVSAPLAGYAQGWTAKVDEEYTTFLQSH